MIRASITPHPALPGHTLTQYTLRVPVPEYNAVLWQPITRDTAQALLDRQAGDV